MSASASIVPLLQTPFSAIPPGEKHLREALLPIPDTSAVPEELVDVCAVHGWPPALYPIIKTSDEWKALGGLGNSEFQDGTNVIAGGTILLYSKLDDAPTLG